MSKRSSNRKIPTAQRFFQWLFPKLEKISPALANRLFIRLFFTPLNYRMPESEKQFLEQSSGFIFHVNGKKLQGYAWGEGPPVLLVHGWAGRGTQLGRFVPFLIEAGYGVVSFDGPAHGQSEGRKTDILEYKLALDEIGRIKGPFRAAICHSFGGTAMLYAIVSGLSVGTLVNISSPTIGDDIVEAYLYGLNASPRVGNAFRKYIIDRTGKTFDDWSALAFIRRVPQNLHLLLVHDGDDREVSIHHAETLQGVFPAAQLYRTEGLGHYRILKDEQTIRHVVDFLLKNAPPHV